jgi:hypothetical protein
MLTNPPPPPHTHTHTLLPKSAVIYTNILPNSRRATQCTSALASTTRSPPINDIRENVLQISHSTSAGVNNSIAPDQRYTRKTSSRILRTRLLLSGFLTIHSLAAVASDAEFLATVCNRNKSSIRRTDAQLDLLKDHLNGSQLVRFTNQFYILTVLPDSCRITWGLPVLGPRGMSTPHPPSPQISRNTHKTSSRILAGLHSAHQHWHQQLDRPRSAIYTKRPPDLS